MNLKSLAKSISQKNIDWVVHLLLLVGITTILLALALNIFLYTNRTYLHWSDSAHIEESDNSSLDESKKNENLQIRKTEKDVCDLSEKDKEITITIADKNPITVKAGSERTNTQIDVMDKMTNETLLAILALLLGFAGILSYAFREVVKKNLEDKLDKELMKSVSDERKASLAENRLVTSYILDKEYNSQKKQNKDLLNDALKNAKTAFETSEELPKKEEYIPIKLKAKNNYLYCLFERQEEIEDISKIDPCNKRTNYKIRK